MDLRVERYDGSQEEEWDNFVNTISVNGTIFHTRQFLKYHPPDRFLDTSILVRDGSSLVCVVPVCKTEDGYFSHKGSSYGGPVIHPEYYLVNPLNELLLVIEKHFDGKLGMRLAPSIFGQRSNDPLVYMLGMRHRVIRELAAYRPLREEEDFVEGIPRRRMRRAVRSLLRRGFVTETAVETEQYEAFYSILENVLERHEAVPTHSLDEFLDLRGRLGSKQLLLVGHEPGHSMVAGLWMIKASHHAWHVFYSGKDYQNGDDGVLPCVFAEAMRLAKSAGASFLNLGISTEQAGERMNLKLFHFKEGMGCHTINRYTLLPKDVG